MIEKFDLQKFNQYKVKNIATYNSDNGMVIEMRELGETYLKVISSRNSPFSTRLTFYKSNRSIKRRGTFFYNNPVGVSYEYDDQANLTKQINCDSAYNFSIEKLIDLLKNKYQTDLMIPTKNIFVNRYINDATHRPEYEIIIRSEYPFFLDILINGNTGDIIEEKAGNYIED